MFVPLVAAALLAQSLSLSAAVAPRAEQFHFRFDNPSSFSTTELVPHFFEQRYDVVPLWFSADARYQLGDLRATTSAAISLRGNRHGSDIDTFLQPSGDVVTAGTDGDVSLRSWEVRQRIATDAGHGWSIGLTLAARHDVADFLPADRIVTHTSPASTSRTFITDRETTTARTLSVGVDAERVRAISRGWQMRYSAGVQPLVQSRLVVQLPDKYPGADLEFASISFAAHVEWTIAHQARRFLSGATIRAAGARGYRSSSSYGMQSVSVTLFAGMRSR